MVYRLAHRAACVAAIGCVLGCAPEPRREQPTAPSPPPTLRRVEAFRPGLAGPENLGMMSLWVAVAPNGTVAFAGGYDSAGRQITVVDTTGKVLSRFGKKGQGPGELDFPVKIAMTDSTISVVSTRPPRITTFTHDGRVIRTAPAPTRAMVLEIHADSIDVMELDISKGVSAVGASGFSRVSLDGGGTRVLIDSTNAGFREFAAPVPGAGRVVTFAANELGFALMRPATRRLRTYDAKGALTHQADSLPLTASPLLDRHGRVWIIGTRDGGPVQAVVVDRGSVVAEMTFECKGTRFPALEGDWLLLPCLDNPANPKESNLDLHLYRIEGS